MDAVEVARKLDAKKDDAFEINVLLKMAQTDEIVNKKAIFE